MALRKIAKHCNDLGGGATTCSAFSGGKDHGLFKKGLNSNNETLYGSFKLTIKQKVVGKNVCSVSGHHKELLENLVANQQC